MSAFIGNVRGPNHNSPHDAADAWCSRAGVEVRVFNSDLDAGKPEREGVMRTLDPVAARNLAALLVRASEEADRMRAREERSLARDDRQRAVVKWAGETFGKDSLSPFERAMRVLEEAIELAQAEGVPREKLDAVATHVYGKPAGDPAQEVGGIGVCLLAYSEVRGLSADREEVRELERVLAIDPAHFRARHNAKAAAGIAVRASDEQSARGYAGGGRHEPGGMLDPYNRDKG